MDEKEVSCGALLVVGLLDRKINVLGFFLKKENFLLIQPYYFVFQATGMELNLSKNGISCGDQGMTGSVLG